MHQKAKVVWHISNKFNNPSIYIVGESHGGRIALNRCYAIEAAKPDRESRAADIARDRGRQGGNLFWQKLLNTTHGSSFCCTMMHSG